MTRLDAHHQSDAIDREIRDRVDEQAPPFSEAGNRAVLRSRSDDPAAVDHRRVERDRVRHVAAVPTISLTNAWRAGVSNELITPWMTCSQMICPTVIRSVNVSTASIADCTSEAPVSAEDLALDPFDRRVRRRTA
jgi:hypothetical protein